jgi:hypothetical protein
VENVSVFRLIETIYSQRRNNVVRSFERFSDIESWLREQWAGRFQELLEQKSEKQQLSALTAQVEQLKVITETLKHYLEGLMPKVMPPAESSKLIQDEALRMEAIKESMLPRNGWMLFLARHGLPFEKAVASIQQAENFEDYLDRIREGGLSRADIDQIASVLRGRPAARVDCRKARAIVGKSDFQIPMSVQESNESAAGSSGNKLAELAGVTTRRRRNHPPSTTR